jgi:galactose-1-phosphate uridylyltransferase
MVEEQLARVIKKVTSIQKYLEKYWQEEQYQWKLMFKNDGE